ATVEKVSPAFPKLNKETIMAELEKDAPAAAAPQATAADQTPTVRLTEVAPMAQEPPASNIISIDDFVKVELRAATVLTAERVPKADKLLRLTIDVGETQPRQILAGIAEHYAPEEVVGRKIIVVANLAPRKLRGLESNGMLLAASVGDEGKPVLATFGEDV